MRKPFGLPRACLPKMAHWQAGRAHTFCIGKKVCNLPDLWSRRQETLEALNLPAKVWRAKAGSLCSNSTASCHRHMLTYSYFYPYLEEELQEV